MSETKALYDLITGALQGKVVVGTIEKAAAELASLRAELDEVREALERHVEWLENVDHDYSNGNSACGCDEGAVLGQRGESQLLASSHAVLARYPGGEK